MTNTQTSAVYEAAIDAIRDEMASNTQDVSIGVVGEFMTRMLMQRPEIADTIMAEGKSLKGAMGAMKEYAQKHRTGSYAAVDFFTGIGIVIEYYGIEKLSNSEIMTIGFSAIGMDAPQEPEAPARKTAKDSDEFDIDALLDGLEG